MPPKPKVTPRAPSEIDAAASKIAAKYGRDTASSQRRKSAKQQAAGTASSEAANPEARVGSLDKPYERKDKVRTSSTTIHLPVDIHKRLRTAAVDRNVHMSSIVADAVAAWLDANGA